jgi:hypothetical protein
LEKFAPQEKKEHNERKEIKRNIEEERSNFPAKEKHEKDGRQRRGEKGT